MNKTMLYDEHLKLSAKMVPFAGWEMPIQYESVKKEVLAVRKNAGVFDVSHMGEFFVEGNDATKFVDFLLTNDFKNIEEKKALYSPLCRENGTVIDDLIAYKINNNRILICVNAANAAKDWNWISSQKGNFNCTLSDKSKDYSLLALQGPQSFEILKKIGIIEKNKPSEDFSYYSAQSLNYENNEIFLARTGYTGEDGFEIFIPNDMAVNVWQKLMECNVTPCGLASRDVLRIEVTYPLYGNEIHDEVTPLDSALKWTVKLNKESFIGKDALSKYTPKFRLIKLTVDKGIPRTGYPIYNSKDEKIGKVTSGTMSPILDKGIALAHVEINGILEDKIFFIEIRGKKIETKYITKPFVAGGHK